MRNYYRAHERGKEQANKSAEGGGAQHRHVAMTLKVAVYPYMRENFFRDNFVTKSNGRARRGAAHTAARSPASRSTAASSVSSFFENEKRTYRRPS